MSGVFDAYKKNTEKAAKKKKNALNLNLDLGNIASDIDKLSLSSTQKNSKRESLADKDGMSK